MKEEDKKEIGVRTTVKGIITGFVCYGIIFAFILFAIGFIANHFMSNTPAKTARVLYITLPLMAVIILYGLIHLICRLSNMDLFKKCKTHPNNYNRISKYINLFIIVTIVLCIIMFSLELLLNLTFQEKSINYTALKQSEVFSEDYVNILKTNNLTKFNDSKTNLTISTIILTLGISVSLLSLIPYQNKMLDIYNTYKIVNNENNESK